MSALREIREERGLSQGRLARLAGVSRVTVHRIEHGRQRPHVGTARKLAGALGVASAEIFPEMSVRPDDPSIGVELTREVMDKAMPYIKKAARGRALNAGDVEELVGAGLEGLYEACRKYDPSRGVPFDRYAVWLSVCRVKDEARRLYRQHPGFGLEALAAKGIEPYTY